jgi:hypothetical protein
MQEGAAVIVGLSGQMLLDHRKTPQADHKPCASIAYPTLLRPTSLVLATDSPT